MSQLPAAELARLIETQLHGAPTPAETTSLEQALRTDPAFRRAWLRAANLDSALRDWAERDEISFAWIRADPPARTVPSRFRWWWSLGVAPAAVLSIAMYQFGTLAAPQPLAPRTQVLADRTVVELNGPAVVVSEYSASERHVRLERGEAHFTVTKDPARPFTVTAAGVTVQAVGTAFNVRLVGATVEVLVTEGQVRLLSADATAVAKAGDPVPTGMPSPERILAARQRAVFAAPLTSAAPDIATLTLGEIERVLAWQHRLLDFTATPLGEVVAEFNRRNAAQLVLVDAELATLRVSASLRSDNVLGFVKMLETGFAVRAERRGETEILLRRPP